MRPVDPPRGDRPRPGGSPWVIGVLLAGWLVSVQGAQARGFRLGRWTGVTELGFVFHSQDQTVLGTERPLFERAVSEQRLGFRNTATVVSRRFLTVDFGLTLGFLQSRLTDSGGEEAAGDGRLRGFDLGATFMPLKSYGFNLLSSRTDNVTPVEFAGSRRLQTSTLGLVMQIGPKFFPARLSYRHLELEGSADLGRSVRGLDQETRTLSYRAENRWRRNEAYLFFQYQDVDDRVSNGFSNETQTASLNHTVELLAPQLATLRSSVRYFDRAGDLPSSSFHLDEELRLRHSDSLTSGLRYELRDLESSSGLPSESERTSAWLHHSLWQSLETRLLIGRMGQSSAAGSSDQDEARLELDYRKNLPLGGRLLGRIATTYEQRDSLLGDGDQLIERERMVARFGVPYRLDRPAVIPGSVIVTDELGSTVFEENVEYEIRFVGEFAEILPLPGGRIAEGQALLVEYRVAAPAMSEFTTRRNDFYLSVDYRWIMPFVGLHRYRYDLREGQPSFLLDDRRERFVGLRLRKSGARLKLLSFNESRDRRSNLLAFDSLRSANGLSYSPKPSWTVRASAVHIETRYDVPKRYVQIDEGKLAVLWRPVPALGLESYVSSRKIHDTLAADQTFDRAGLEGRWNLGKLTVIASAERWQRSRNGQDLDGITGSLRISRRFFPGTVTSRRRVPEPEPWPADLPGLAPEPFADGAAWAQGETAGSEASRYGIRRVVEDWAQAWADRDADRHLSFYADGFRPADGMSRQTWERQRRSSLAEPTWIEVGLDSLVIQHLGEGRARATFSQTYRSNLASDVVDKTLELSLEAERWRIVEEIVG